MGKREQATSFTQSTSGLDTVLLKLSAAVEWLEKAGAKPTGNGYRRNGHGNGNSNGNAPTCPTHGTPMRQSKHGGGWYCPHKVADDDGTGKPVYWQQRVK